MRRLRRLGSVCLSIAVLFGLTAALEAQGVEAASDNTQIEVDGEVETTFFSRDTTINEVLEGGAASGAGDQNDVLYEYTLGLTVDVGDNVTGRLEVENTPLDQTSAAGPGGVNANDSAIIGENVDDGENVQLGQAYIEAGNFLSENLTLKVGIQDYTTDLRGDGNAFLIDLRGSESVSDSLTTVQENAVTAGTAATTGRDLNNDAGGALLEVAFNENHTLDLFWFTTRDDTSVTDENDDQIYGGRLHGGLQDQGSYQLILNVFDHSSAGPAATPGGGGVSQHYIWNLGGGVEYDVSPDGNVYGELYFQGGDEYDTNSDQDTAFAGYIGYEHQMEQFWFDVSYTHVTGDSGEDRFDGGAGEDNEDFVSYEDNDATMILEDNVLGLDVDSNYMKLQGEIGTTFTTGIGAGEDDFGVDLLVAWAQNETNVENPVTGDELVDDLGIETDLVFTWTQNESMTWELGVARLWGADFFEDTEGGRGFNAGDGLDLWTFTGNLNF